MILEFDGQHIQVDANNGELFIFDNDMMNGLYADFDDDYVFISADTPNFAEIEEHVDDEGIEVTLVHQYNAADAPYCFIINSLARMTVFAAEQFLGQQEND